MLPFRRRVRLPPGGKPLHGYIMGAAPAGRASSIDTGRQAAYAPVVLASTVGPGYAEQM